jgi:hypothetical protein
VGDWSGQTELDDQWRLASMTVAHVREVGHVSGLEPSSLALTVWIMPQDLAAVDTTMSMLPIILGNSIAMANNIEVRHVGSPGRPSSSPD